MSIEAIRKVDELGRIVIPIDLRRELGFKENDDVRILVEKDALIIKKCVPQCIICKSEKNLKNAVINGSEVSACQNCAREISNL